MSIKFNCHKFIIVAKPTLRPSNLSIIKIINNNVVVIIIVLAWFCHTRKLCSDLRVKQKQVPQHDHKQFSSVSALPQ